MSRYVVDAWAWIEYFRGKHPEAKLKIETEYVITSAVTVAEVASKFSREGYNVEDAVGAISSLSKVVLVDTKSAKEAGVLHSQMKRTRPNFSLADSFVLQTARSANAKILTGDKDFKGLKDVIMLTK
jgi:predicted nucleic acid-binding protein